MILTKEIEIEIKKGNYPYYKKKYPYVKIGDVIKVSIDDLSKGSNQVIEAKCSFCKNVVEIQYKLYYKRSIKHEDFACCRKCSSLRNSQLLNEKYGVTSSSILSLYGLREAKDVDFLHRVGSTDISNDLFGSHNSNEYYNKSIDDMIYNPNNYFYSFGIKFSNMDIVRDMKMSRGKIKISLILS